MPHTQLRFRDEARNKILAGAGALADAVRGTLGPKAHCVLIEKKWGNPIVCDDGVTIAKAVDLKDAEENLGARMLREAAVRTGDEVGDGTTSSTVLAYAILSAGARNVVAAYELALASARSYQPGDQVSYYVSGEGKRVKVNEAAKLAHDWVESVPDENTAYYVAKLQELYEKFRPLIEQDGLIAVVDDEPEAAPEAPEQLSLYDS